MSSSASSCIRLLRFSERAEPVTERLPCPAQQRLGGLDPEPEPLRDLAHAEPLDVLPLERIPVAPWQRVERDVHEARGLRATQRLRGAGRRLLRERLERRSDLGNVL